MCGDVGLRTDLLDGVSSENLLVTLKKRVAQLEDELDEWKSAWWVLSDISGSELPVLEQANKQLKGEDEAWEEWWAWKT